MDEHGRLRLAAASLASSRLVGMPTTSGIRLQARRLDRLDQEPEELVGAAKELVEATAKHVLTELGDPIGDTEDVASLSKRALTRLKLHPTAIAPTTEGRRPMSACWEVWHGSRVPSPNSGTWVMGPATAAKST